MQCMGYHFLDCLLRLFFFARAADSELWFAALLFKNSLSSFLTLGLPCSSFHQRCQCHGVMYTPSADAFLVRTLGGAILALALIMIFNHTG